MQAHQHLHSLAKMGVVGHAQVFRADPSASSALFGYVVAEDDARLFCADSLVSPMTSHAKYDTNGGTTVPCHHHSFIFAGHVAHPNQPNLLFAS